MSDQAGQSNPQVDTAGQSGLTSTETPDAPSSNGADLGGDTSAGDEQASSDEQDGDPAGHNNSAARRNREAQYRHRAQAAEAERDQLRAQLAAVQQQTVDDIAAAAGVNPRLLAAAGRELGEFIDQDGRVDRERVQTACAQAAAEFGVPPKPQGLAPNPQQGAGDGQAPGGTELSRVINKAMGR